MYKGKELFELPRTKKNKTNYCSTLASKFGFVGKRVSDSKMTSGIYYDWGNGKYVLINESQVFHR